MRRNGIYSANIKRDKPIAKILAVVFGVLIAVLLTFIIWSALTFGHSNPGGYVPQAEEISTLKITVEEQKKEIENLRQENVELKAALEEEKEKYSALLYAEEVTEETTEENVQSDEE